MTSGVSSFVELELKYCEQCGGLWLRRQGSGEAHCGRCSRFLQQLPPRARDNRRRGGSGPLRRRLRKQYRLPGPELVPVEYLVARAQSATSHDTRSRLEPGDAFDWAAANTAAASLQEAGPR